LNDSGNTIDYAALEELYSHLAEYKPDAQIDFLGRADLTSDQFVELDLFASSTRVGSGHEEDPRAYPGQCLICGDIETPDDINAVDYYYHPLAAGHFLAFRGE